MPKTWSGIKMRWLDLFSGVGMYGLGLEQAGHEIIGFCEVDKFCHKILKKHWKTKPSMRHQRNN